MTPERILIAFWLVLVVYWVIPAREVRRNKNQERARWGRSGGAIAVVLLALSRSRYLQFRPARPNAITDGLALMLCAGGVAFAIWGRRHLGKNWSTSPLVREGHQLITSGPYAWVRHPIYTGILAGLLGTALVGTILWWIVFVVACPVFVYRAKAEENLLVRQFRVRYPEYKKRTKALVPFVW